MTPYSWAIQTMTSSTIEAPSSASEERAVVQPHLIDQLDRRLVTVLKVIGFGLPIVTYFWVVFHFGVNVIYGDQLSDISVVSASQHHFLPWEALWAQYQDNRLLFPNLIVLLLARTVALNIHTEELVERDLPSGGDCARDRGTQEEGANDAMAVLLPGRTAHVLPRPVPGHSLRVSAGVVSHLAVTRRRPLPPRCANHGLGGFRRRCGGSSRR